VHGILYYLVALHGTTGRSINAREGVKNGSSNECIGVLEEKRSVV
jgi:hypothetical protein